MRGLAVPGQEKNQCSVLHSFARRRRREEEENKKEEEEGLEEKENVCPIDMGKGRGKQDIGG